MSFTFAASLLALTFAAGSSADPLMNPGKWTVDVTVTVENAPIKLPPKSITQCVTPEQAANPVPLEDSGDGQCKMSNYKIDGKVVTWSVYCDKQKMSGHGSITFASDGDSYEGVVAMTSESVKLNQTLRGKRVGDCE
jgi:hypothetical protein